MMLTMMMRSLGVQCVLDLVVAGFSLIIGLGIFVFTASILCSAAFFHNAKAVS
ncbi:chaperonin 60 subunit beta [Fagus crenata]